jgi:hypothetical protein
VIEDTGKMTCTEEHYMTVLMSVQSETQGKVSFVYRANQQFLKIVVIKNVNTYYIYVSITYKQ